MCCAVALFVIIMDLLKYVFRMDLTKDELKKVRRERRVKRRKPPRRPPVIQRFVYANESSTAVTREEPISIIEETTV